MKHLSLCYCIVLALGTAQLFVAVNPSVKQSSKNFSASLDENQKKMYELVTDERKKLSHNGLMLGAVLGLLVIFLMPNPFWQSVCVFLAITLLTQYFWYMLTPKQFWLVPYLTQMKQRTEWVEVYQKFQFNYTLGVLCGLVICFIWCNRN